MNSTRAYLAARAAEGAQAWWRLAKGLVTGALALGMLVVLVSVTTTALMTVGLPLVPVALGLMRRVADRERRRLAIPSPHQPHPGGWLSRLRGTITDPATRRDCGWLALRALLLFPGVIVVALPLEVVKNLTFPLWWSVVPPDQARGALGIPVTTWTGAFAMMTAAPVWLLLGFVLTRYLVGLQDSIGRRLLGVSPGVDLSTRITQLTATRAAALDAHAAELRRIERALHDGAQNKLVSVAILAGAARRAVNRDPASADAMLERAQAAAEEALAELRTVIRGILPPILDQRGLDGALAALAAGSPVPCTVSVDVPVRCPTSVEATAYFVVAEALTNTARHSGAANAAVGVRRVGDVLEIEVSDDGRGGATESGSGLAGLRGRVAAHDGTLAVSSPAGGPTIVRVELPCGS
ncbi:sensor histidine kinase [Longispora albida]|uniref:sensor histidine kinase n=1 Tax=Longispora albida TaxID=203523 RepID=UPI0003740AB6|nr:sensor histidine kinase [Longispora albida]